MFVLIGSRIIKKQIKQTMSPLYLTLCFFLFVTLVAKLIQTHKQLFGEIISTYAATATTTCTLAKPPSGDDNNLYDPNVPITTKRNCLAHSKGEQECRKVLEQIFERPFPKQRPDFLANHITGEGNNLELDCYNADLGIAVEYNGRQHYNYVPYFHKNHDQFVNQKYRDDMKRRLCAENKVILIEVPYTIAHKNIKKYLIKALRDHRVV